MRLFSPSIVALSLLVVTPYVTARAAESAGQESSISTHARTLAAAVKRDTKKVGAGFKEGAHRVAIAAKAVGHEVATAAKHGATETRAAFRGENPKTPAT